VHFIEYLGQPVDSRLTILFESLDDTRVVDQITQVLTPEGVDMNIVVLNVVVLNVVDICVITIYRVIITIDHLWLLICLIVFFILDYNRFALNILSMLIFTMPGCKLFQTNRTL
jgi:hypothetical protein